MSESTRPHDPPDLISIYRTTVGELYAYVRRRTDDTQLAEDIVQESYLRAVRSWHERGLPETPLAWLRTVARNLLVSHYRQRQPDPTDPAAIETFFDGAPDDGEAVTMVHWGLAQLKPNVAHLLESFHMDGKSVAVIARETGMSERAVEGRLHRGRKTLRRALAPHVTPHAKDDAHG